MRKFKFCFEVSWKKLLHFWRWDRICAAVIENRKKCTKVLANTERNVETYLAPAISVISMTWVRSSFALKSLGRSGLILEVKQNLCSGHILVRGKLPRPGICHRCIDCIRVTFSFVGVKFCKGHTVFCNKLT